MHTGNVCGCLHICISSLLFVLLFGCCLGHTRLGASDGKVSRQMASRLTNSSQIEAFIPHYIDNIKNMFAFAFIWSFGGHLHDR